MKLIYNVGYFGIGKYSTKNNPKAYRTWNHMITRCYSEKQQIIQPSYMGCSVDERWYNFQVFAEWFENNYIEGFALDKDILVKGNKIYSPETCCFVPLQINQLFSVNSINRGNTPIGVRVSRNLFQVSLKKFGKHITYGSYKTTDEAFKVFKYHKELYIKEVADIWKDKITTETYQALYNYQVEITD